MSDRIESISLDSDEGGWYMQILALSHDGSEHNVGFFLPDHLAEEAHAAFQPVRDRIAEVERMRAAYHTGTLTPPTVLEDEMRDAYEITDPKHPDFVGAAEARWRDRRQGK